MSYPRPWPYPDRWLCALVDWFDARNPPEGDVIKIHGERPSVRVAVFFALALSLQLLAPAIVLFRRRLWEITHQPQTSAPTGGTALVLNDAAVAIRGPGLPSKVPRAVLRILNSPKHFVDVCRTPDRFFRRLL
jgi:hypothetical protein